MKKKFTLIAIATFGFLQCFAAGTLYEWEKDRVAYKLTEEEQAMGELILKQHHQYDYALEDGFIMYSAVHRIIYVNNDEAVQKNNRISISMNNTIDLVELKARVINKNGKIIHFNKSELKELKDEESGNAYRIFAMEGVELGSEIEYYFIRKMRGAIFERVNLQSDVQVKRSTMLITSPGHLKFDFKNYNTTAEVVREEAKDPKETNRYSLDVQDIPPMKDESYSYFVANLAKVEFKLAYNTARSMARIYTWDEAAKTFYKILYTLDKDEEKALDKFVKSIGDKPSAGLRDRIVNVEDKIKKEIKVDPKQSGEQLASIESITKFKIASNEGITRLFIAVYGKLGINCHPVITSDREKCKFDGKFDSWSYLDNYVIYFPDTNGFIAPYQYEVRYPLIPSAWSGQDALFIQPITIGDLKSALGTIAEIPAPDYTISKDNLNIDVSFNEDLRVSNIKMLRELSGYDGAFVIPYYDLMTDDQKKTLVEELIKQTAPDAIVKTWSTKIAKGENGDKLLIDLNFQSSHFLEKAGPRILFKAGLVIGPQLEMYRDETRMNAVENDYNRSYEREIRIQIPQGYIIKNPEDLKMKVVYENDKNIPFSFESNYTLEGNILKLTILEYYKELRVPLARYDDFRKVINASADFNKVTLVLEKAK